MDEKKRLDELRAHLADVDHQILRLLERRARIGQDIIRQRGGTARFAPIADGPHLQSLENAVTPPLSPSAIREAFVAIDAACRLLETAPRVLFVGHEGGVGWQAARDHFGVGANFLRSENSLAALEELAASRAEFAVVPYESLSDGPIFPTIQAVAAMGLKLVGERELTPRQTSDPAEKLEIRRENVGNVGDVGQARMRYGVISRLPAPRSGADATALLFGVHDRPGALHEILHYFKDKNCNLRRIQSRPLPGEGWEYQFYVEVSGHVTDRNLVAALEGIKHEAKMLVIVGSFPLERPERVTS